MIPPEAIAQFVDGMKHLLRRTYDEAWQRGVDSYEPDPDPDEEPTLPLSMATTGLTGAALLWAHRRYRYVPPIHPAPIRRVVALAPAFRGINRMANELSALPGSDLSSWADANAYRLNAGDSVAWAGEQSGYAEAANVDGQFLYAWITEGDNRVCSDCELLSGYPPMSLDQWPTAPGAGDTECGPGCRCSWDIFSATLPANYVPSLTPDQVQLSGELAARQAQALSDMFPDASYLEG